MVGAANIGALPSASATASLDARAGAPMAGSNEGADAAEFASHFKSLGGGDVLRPAAGGTPNVAEPSKLEQLSSYFQGRAMHHAAAMSRVVMSRDPAALVRVAAEGMDMGVQSDLVSKFIGKSVSAVDAITKLN